MRTITNLSEELAVELRFYFEKREKVLACMYAMRENPSMLSSEVYAHEWRCMDASLIRLEVCGNSIVEYFASEIRKSWREWAGIARNQHDVLYKGELERERKAQARYEGLVSELMLYHQKILEVIVQRAKRV